jgi:peroxiredoxin Q/BCP
VIGISPDSPESHAKFIAKKDLKVTLLSDQEKDVIKAYGKWGKKSFRGKEYMGVTRSTFIIDPDGKFAHIWPKVSVTGHVREVKKIITDLQ